MTRFVFDTNVMISALLFKDSLPGRAFFRASHRGMILISGAFVGELSRVLRTLGIRGGEKPLRFMNAEKETGGNIP